MAISSVFKTFIEEAIEHLQSTGSRSFAAVCLLSLTALGIIIYRLFLHPLAGIPGPWLAHLTGLWRTYHYFRGTWHEDVLALHNTYGRLVRIAPGELSVVDGGTLKRLYGHGKPAQKTPWYSTWEIPGASTAFFAQQDPKYHSFLRKRVSHVYSMTSIVAMEPYIQGCLDLMFQLLHKYADSGETIDMSEWTNAFAYDVVGEIAYGERFGHLESEKDVMGLRQAIFDRFYLMANMGHIWGQMFFFDNPITGTFVKWLGLVNTGPYAKFQSWTNEKVLARREGKSGSSRKDMLNHFLNMEKINGEPASHSEVMMEALNIVGAGADTTSIAMRTCLFYLCQNPSVYTRLQEEVDNFYDTNDLKEPISYTQALTLPYLQAVIKEATRLLPSIVYQLLRYVPAGGITIDDRFIPEGSVVGISPISQNRDKAIWGEDADVFRPERWIEDEAHGRYLESMSMTFGGNGPRACIGKNIALFELSKFLSQLLRNFDVELVDKERPWTCFTAWFVYQFDMNVRLRSRRNQTLRKL